MISVFCGVEIFCRSQRPSGLRRGSTVDRLLGLRVRILPGIWIFVSCVLNSKDKKANARTVRTKETSTDKSTDKETKNPTGNMFIYVVSTGKMQDKRKK